MFKDKPLYYNHFLSAIVYLLVGGLFAAIIYSFNRNYSSPLILFGGMALLQLIFGFSRYKQHRNEAS